MIDLELQIQHLNAVAWSYGRSLSAELPLFPVEFPIKQSQR